MNARDLPSVRLIPFPDQPVCSSIKKFRHNLGIMTSISVHADRLNLEMLSWVSRVFHVRQIPVIPVPGSRFGGREVVGHAARIAKVVHDRGDVFWVLVHLQSSFINPACDVDRPHGPAIDSPGCTCPASGSSVGLGL